MASGDFADLYGKAIRASRRDSTYAQDVTDAKAAINEALQAVSFTGDPWNWLEKEGQFTLTAGSDTYTVDSIGIALGTTVSDLFSITMDSGRNIGYTLQSMSWQALEGVSDSTQDDEGDGCPAYWASWDRRVRFYPVPDANYTMGCFYRAYQSELTLDADVPLMPLEWRTRLLVPYAASVLLRQEGGSEAAGEADRYTALYQVAFRDCRTALATAKTPALALSSPSWMDA